MLLLLASHKLDVIETMLWGGKRIDFFVLKFKEEVTIELLHSSPISMNLQVSYHFIRSTYCLLSCVCVCTHSQCLLFSCYQWRATGLLVWEGLSLTCRPLPTWQRSVCVAAPDRLDAFHLG